MVSFSFRANRFPTILLRLAASMIKKLVPLILLLSDGTKLIVAVENDCDISTMYVPVPPIPVP